MICYESLFPGYVGRHGASSAPPADLIVNISNDAWFGQTSGPWQHLNQASYRAIEEGLPIIRATPTGVSSVIDKYGRVQPQARLGLSESGVVDGEVRLSQQKETISMNAVQLGSSFISIDQLAFLAMLSLSVLFSVRIRFGRSKGG